MHKIKAIELLGGTITAAAEAIPCSYQAVKQWPDELPPRIADRVLAVLARKYLPKSVLDELTGDTTSAAGQPDVERMERAALRVKVGVAN